MTKTKKTHDTTTFTLSHSSLSIIEQCPRKWYLRYIKGHYFDTPQPWSDFGLMAHEVGEKYRGEGIDRIKELARDAVKNRNLTIHDTYKHKVPVALKNIKRFYDKYLAKASKVSNEKEFRIDLTPYVDLVGLIDVLYKDEYGDWVVVDFKTSKSKSEHSRQLSLYYFLMSEITGKKPTTLKAQIVYLSLENLSEDIEEIVDEYVLDHDDIRACENRLQSGIDIIANCGCDDSKWRKKPSTLCNYCIFKEYNLCNAKKQE